MTLRIVGALGALLVASAASAQEANCPVSDYTMSLRYQQNSAEIAALQIQAYNLATLRLDAAIEGVDDPSRLAVVADLDETVIDNTPLLVRDLNNCHDFTAWETWRHWERDGSPTLIPGAKAFLDHADTLGVTISYISDRTDDQKAYTIETLNELELPQVSEGSVLLLGPGKPERRAIVEEDHEIILLLGDTLHDFDEGLAGDTHEARRETVLANDEKFGDIWIMFPNAAYGAWDDAELEAWDAEEILEDY